MIPDFHCYIKATFIGVAYAFAPLLQGAPLSFNRDIRPLLSENCLSCHGPSASTRKGDLRLDDRDAAVSAGAIAPGNAESSELVARLFSRDPEEIMPPPDSRKKITPAQRALLKHRVLEGAPYEKHWAFVPPVLPQVPGPAGRKLSPIDAFVQSRLDASGLTPSVEADRETLLRRVTLDLTGLPPTISEIDSFLSDSSITAYENAVDRLLRSPRFGERMAVSWLDAARYGDSSVKHADGPRDMWPWRDWVVEAFNSNMPFDRFTIEQIAGDLLPQPSIAQMVASGFNRNHATSDEGGAIPEELRVEYVVDRVKTTSTVWLGLTMECAQCHDHKYDPISQREYYQFFAYFNNTSDPGMQTRNGNQAPVVTVVAPVEEEKLRSVRLDLTKAEQQLQDRRTSAKAGYAAWAVPPASDSGTAPPQEPEGLQDFVPLDEREGRVVTNILGGKAGAVAGKLQTCAREAGRGVRFDGSTEVTFSDGPDFDGAKPFTFAAWVKLPASSGGAILSRMDVKDSFKGFDFWVQGRSIGTHVINQWPRNALKVVTKEPLSADQWHHVVVTYDGSMKAFGVSLYVDGQLQEKTVEQDSLKGKFKSGASFKLGARSEAARVQGEIDDLRIYQRAVPASEIDALKQDPVRTALAVPEARRSPTQKNLLFEYYLAHEDGDYLTALSGRARAELALAELTRGQATSMVMQDNAANPRMTYILNRGNYDQPKTDAIITPGVPSALPPLPPGAPSNRLGLARWLTDPGNPLTARVAVNRVWMLLFGNGLVRTLGDFGMQGELPTHPELLDWLARDFVSHGWDLKRLVKQMVVSSTYRQSSHQSDVLRERDPENRLLAQGGRHRLEAEFLRDQALSVAGLLVDLPGGPSVKPYQPDGIWGEVNINAGLKYDQDKGDKLYRRSLYTYWKRSSPIPNMILLDAPSRESCVVQRSRTNTPLQALVLLNDPQFVEAARAFAQRLLKSGARDTAARVDLAYRLATGRKATPHEIAVIQGILVKEQARFTTDEAQAKALLAVGDSPRDETISPAEHAAWTSAAQVILNLDETVSRN
ncbi:MAG: DUF1553 domain-containing protein [Verrucomicrobiales bacterium]|nr:DUF1553 domain-containing protein [Verrucomicrobiales bacterium]